MGNVKIEVTVDEQLLNSAKQDLDMSLDDFIEYSLTMYLVNDDEYSKLFNKGAKIYSDLLRIKERMFELEDRNRKNKDNTRAYSESLETIDRIHGKLGYIGKNQLKKIANRNGLNHSDLIQYVEMNTDYEIRNFGAIPK